MTEIDRNERLSVSFHEAGHAVVARYFGKALKQVSIRPRNGGDGWDGNTEPEGNNPPKHPRDEATILLAGFAVDARRDPQSVNWSTFQKNEKYASDRNRVDEIMSKYVPTDTNDAADSDEENPDRENYILDSIIKPEVERANWIITQDRYWSAISSVAERLYEIQEMTGQEVMKVRPVKKSVAP